MPESTTHSPQPRIERVGLFVSCLVDQFFPRVGFSVASVLERLGFEVVVPEGQTCCGQPAFNSGFAHEARPVLESALSCLESANVDAVVVPSGSCAAMLKVFSAELVGHREITRRVFEFSQFLTGPAGVIDVGARFPGRVVYHDSCHLLWAMAESEAPRRLLRAVQGLELMELPEPVCCGFGGTFSVKMPDISKAILDDKIEAILATGAGTVVSTDMSCLAHISGELRRRGSGIRTMHIAEILAG